MIVDDKARDAVLGGSIVRVRITRTETLEVDVALDPQYPEIEEDLRAGVMSVGEIASEFALDSRDWVEEDVDYDYGVVG